MNDVTDKSFWNVYPKLETAINNASFIAIDAEFTGIHSGESVKFSLFDLLSHRYSILRDNIQPFKIVQFGIAVFQRNLDENTYTAECFNFYLFPKPVPFKNRQLSWQVTALEFLYKHNFEFNKFINEGISFLDEIDEQLLRDYVNQDNLINKLEQLSYEEEDDIKHCRSKISGWIKKGPKEPSFKLDTSSPILQYLIQKELRTKFKNIWTTPGFKSVDVIQVTNDMRKLLESEENNRLENALIDSYVGFSAVFRLLSSSNKPIIGHNILLDLMFMHQQFYRPLPDQYKEFKSNIHRLFPQIYDTKFLSFELKKLFGRDEVNWRINSLSALYEYFTSTKGACLAFNSPKVTLNGESVDEKNYHNAVWDAYFAGHIFIKMAHIFCIKKYGPGIEQRAVTHSELMSSVKQFANSVNITRGNEVYMKFDGTDPALSRPEWLHVQLKSSSIDTRQLVDRFSTFGQVDVMPFARKRVLVAVANHKSAQHILQHFQSSKEFQVARYSRIRHAAPTTICLWGGVIFSGGMFAWMFNRVFLKST